MRRIEKAVIKQTLQHDRPGGTGLDFGVFDRFLEEQGRRELIAILSKYIVFSDVPAPYWTDRYWYFDVEKYRQDLDTFGMPIAVAVFEPIQKLGPL